jgi:hypothetical protein
VLEVFEYAVDVVACELDRAMFDSLGAGRGRDVPGYPPVAGGDLFSQVVDCPVDAVGVVGRELLDASEDALGEGFQVERRVAVDGARSTIA